MIKRIHFKKMWLALLLLSPQVLITVVFFVLPAYQSLEQAVFVEDAFGLSREFIGLENFAALMNDDSYHQAFYTSIIFAFFIALLSMGMALMLAAITHYLRFGEKLYNTLLIIPYAVAPILAGALWMFLFDSTFGVITELLRSFGIEWDYKLNSAHAITLIIIASAWNIVSYNFLFFCAAVHSVPKNLLEAAAVDGAGPVRRFRDIIFPLISPTTFFLLIMNMIYAFVYTFGIIHGITNGGPGNSTQTLTYKIYNDGFVGMNFGLSAAQSIILIIIVSVLTLIQFKYIEKRISYGN